MGADGLISNWVELKKGVYKKSALEQPWIEDQ